MSNLVNARVRFAYETLDTFQAGMVLHGWEVKSLRKGDANIKPAWVTLREGELWIENLQVTPYRFSSDVMERDRPKKLLLKKREIDRIERRMKEKGITVVPVKIYPKNGVLKCEIALVRGRKKHEKKQVLKERDMDRRARAAMKQY